MLWFGRKIYHQCVSAESLGSEIGGLPFSMDRRRCSWIFWWGLLLVITPLPQGLSLSIPVSENLTHASSLYYGNSLLPSARSTPEITLSRRLSRRLECPVYLSLSISGAILDKWDLVDPVSRTTLSQDVETQLLDKFGHMLRVHWVRLTHFIMQNSVLYLIRLYF